jgi:hypothetical protein
VDGVPSHEGIQDDVDAAPFGESDETLEETTSYLVDLNKYARRLENESLTLFREIKDATGEARLHLPHDLSWRGRLARSATVFSSLSRASVVRTPHYCRLRGSMWIHSRSAQL